VGERFSLLVGRIARIIINSTTLHRSDTTTMKRKYIRPGSVRIYGLPGTDNRFGLRDNGSGQMWSGDKRVGSINYWTGDIVLVKELVPRVRLWDELLTVFRLRRATHPNVRFEFEVSDLELGSQPEPPLTELKYPLVTGREGPLRIKKHSG